MEFKNIYNKFNKRISTLLMCFALLLFSSVASSTILLDADWEKNNATFNDYFMNISRNTYGSRIVDKLISNVPTCSGTKSVKHELTYGRGSVWSQLVLNLQPFNSFAIGKEHWFSFAVYLPKSYLPDTGYQDLIWELHGRPDTKDGELSRNAPVAIRTKGDQWLISYIKDSRYITYKLGDAKKSYEESKSKLVGKFETGKWTVFVINTLMDYRPNGYLKIWKDGTLVIDKTNGIGFNDAKGPFVKMGLYKAIWDTSKSWSVPTNVSTRIIYMDDFRVGDANATYASMLPNCNNTAAKPRPPTNFQVK